MCPGNDILSVYADDELPSPFKEKVAAHLVLCAVCAEKASSYKAISGSLSAAGAIPKDKTEDAAALVWAKLESRLAYRSQTRSLFWRRKLRVPMPVAAAAALAVFAGFAAIFYMLGSGGAWGSGGGRDGIAAGANGAVLSGEETLISIPAQTGAAPGAVYIQDMREILQFLEEDNDSNTVIIKLPESRSFSRSGEPRFITASQHPSGAGRDNGGVDQ